MQIWGAGISGLIAASVFPQAKIFESQPREKFVEHRALLRFRSTAVADATGIEFRKVRVHKGIWAEATGSRPGFVQPSIALANAYSKKVLNGRIGDRSIWNLEPSDRYVAPQDFVQQLLSHHGDRIHWGVPVTSLAHRSRNSEPVISTIPMHVLARMAGEAEGFNMQLPSFEHRRIVVKRWHVPGADVFQTVYFPDAHVPLYRASITGDLLIAEYVDTGGDLVSKEIGPPCEPFGMVESDCVPLDSVSQRYGKIHPIDEGFRKGWILAATERYNIFSLGRFATWRNILLDDVVKDVAVIKRLLNAPAYDRSKHMHG